MKQFVTEPTEFADKDRVRCPRKRCPFSALDRPNQIDEIMKDHMASEHSISVILRRAVVRLWPLAVALMAIAAIALLVS